MRYLLVDTAFETGVGAIFEEGHILQEIKIPLFANQSRYFFPLLQQLQIEAGISFQELDFITAGIGPGSYTGMRIGAMIAKTFAYALKKPLVGVCSLQGLPATTPGSFAAIIDARISGAYVLLGTRQGNSVQFEASPQIIALEQVGNALDKTPALVTTCGNRIRSRLESKYPHHSWQWEEQIPSIQSLGEVAWQSFLAGKFSNDCQLDLLYLRGNPSGSK